MAASPPTSGNAPHGASTAGHPTVMPSSGSRPNPSVVEGNATQRAPSRSARSSPSSILPANTAFSGTEWPNASNCFRPAAPTRTSFIAASAGSANAFNNRPIFLCTWTLANATTNLRQSSCRRPIISGRASWASKWSAPFEITEIWSGLATPNRANCEAENSETASILACLRPSTGSTLRYQFANAQV